MDHGGSLFSPLRREARGRRTRAAAYVVALGLVLLFLGMSSVQRSRRAGQGLRTQLAGAAVRATPLPFPVPHNLTVTGRVASFAEREAARRCADPYAHPFSGCLTDEYEADTMHRLLSGKAVSKLRCGFLDAPSSEWLAALHRRYAACPYVVFTASFSYGQLPSTDVVVPSQPGVCFAAFVDAAAVEQLRGAGAAFNGTHFGRWELAEVDSGMLSDGVARSAHLMKILAARLFPAASVALYIDIKVALPPDPLAMMRLVERAEAPTMLGVIVHPPEAERDTFDEVVTTVHHLYQRRLRPDPSRDKTVVDRRTAYLKGITARDFHDVFRQYQLFARLRYPMHSNGMLNAATLVWNLKHPAIAAFACLWHNQVAYYSMREQLNFHYVLNMLGLTDQVAALTPIPNSRHPDISGKLALGPTGWPAWGEYAHDEYWGNVWQM